MKNWGKKLLQLGIELTLRSEIDKMNDQILEEFKKDIDTKLKQ